MASVILIIVFLIWIIGFSKKQNDSEEELSETEVSVEVSVTHPSSVTDTLTFESQGTVNAKKRFTITALSEGHIKTVYSSVGDLVKPGQVIAVLENPEMDHELLMQNDKMKFMQEMSDSLEKRVTTAKELLALGILSQSDFVALQQELNTQKSELRDQEIICTRLEARSRNYRVVADMSGYITDIRPERSYIGYGEEVAEVISVDNEQIEAYVPFDSAIQPQKGDTALITCNNLTMAGTVSGSFPEAIANLVKVIVIPESPVPLNLSVKVSFYGQAMQGLLIPKSAVVMEEGRPVVFVVTGGKAIKHVITVVKDYLDRLVITSDIGADDDLVTENAYLLSDQMDVEVK
jgi:RND family efflux transporter MFP subunit